MMAFAFELRDLELASMFHENIKSEFETLYGSDEQMVGDTGASRTRGFHAQTATAQYTSIKFSQDADKRSWLRM